MSKVQLYQPQPVSIPESSSVQRVFPKYSELSDEHRQNLDSRSIFYDVFFDESERRVVGLGPELLNLGRNLWPLRIFISGQLVTYRIQPIKELVFFKTEPVDTILPDQFDVVFEFKSFSITVTLESKNKIPILEHNDSNRLTLTTLQKDNPIPWISDWITWYYRKYGVTRLVFYDNLP